MAAGGSARVIVIAFVGNALIAVSKFVAAAITGSSAMFAEAVHSVVDSGNQLLLLFGMKRATRPADDRHPFGYGMEVYFWSFVVAILLFSIGAGISIYHGVEKILHPHPVENAQVAYIVIALAICFEGYAWWAAVKEFNARRGKEGLFSYVRKSKDAPLFVVVFEDTGALLGLFIALFGLLGADLMGWELADGVATLMIGVLLAVAAILLAIETKGLLIGEAAEPQVVAGVNGIVGGHPGVLAINETLTMHMGPEDILLALSLDFKDTWTTHDLEAAIDEMERDIKARFPEIKRIFIEAQSVFGHLRSAAARSDA